jgi:hypothetical protein
MKNQEKYPGKIFNPIETRNKMIEQSKKAFWLCGNYDNKGLKYYKKSQKKAEMLRVNEFILKSMREKQSLALKTRYLIRNIRVIELPKVISTIRKYF